MTRNISSLSPELTKLIFDAGERVIVLVEGTEDQQVLKDWFGDSLADVYFHPSGGFRGVRDLHDEILSKGTLKKAYGIIDRDFRSEQEVEASYHRDSHLFILRRYALENYLLEPAPLWELLKVWEPDAVTLMADATAIVEKLLEFCQQSKSLMSANWLFFEKNAEAYVSTGETGKFKYLKRAYDGDRDQVIRNIVKQLGCSDAEAESLLKDREDLLEESLNDLENAHRVTDGKRLLHLMNREYPSLAEDRFRRLMIREIRQHGIPAEITHIIKTRILAVTAS